MGHIIGRPDDRLLDVMLGRGIDPEQAFIDGSDRVRDKRGDRREDRVADQPPGSEP